MTPLSDEVRSSLRKYGITPRKKLGQSFLINSSIAREIVKAASLKRNDDVLEIGGGLGVLTRWLVESARKVFVVEKDRGLANALRSSFAEHDNLEVMEGDALEIQLPKVSKIVANLPYSVSSPLTFRLLDYVDFQQAVLMYQKEFAQRLLAKPGTSEYSRLTIEVNYRANVEMIMQVNAREFYPVPKVDSMVVRLVPRESGPVAQNEGVFHWMVRGVYSYPNKLIRKAFGIWFRNLSCEDSVLAAFIQRCSGEFNGSERLRDLDLGMLVKLSDHVLEMINDGLVPYEEREQE